MLVLSNGAPKSATSLFFHFTKELLRQDGRRLSLDALERIFQADNFYKGGFVHKLEVSELEALVDAATYEEPIVIKVHTAPKPEIMAAIKHLPDVYITYGYRDPRDMILSAKDHHQRVLKEGSLIFEEVNQLTAAMTMTKKWAIHSNNWIGSGLAHTYQYADLVSDPETELHRLAEFLKVSVTPAAIQQIIDEERALREPGKNQFNQAKLTRYQAEMSQQEQQLYAAEFYFYLNSFGINANKISGASYYERPNIADKFQPLPLLKKPYLCVCTLPYSDGNTLLKALDIRCNSKSLPSSSIYIYKNTVEFLLPDSFIRGNGNDTLEFRLSGSRNCIQALSMCPLESITQWSNLERFGKHPKLSRLNRILSFGCFPKQSRHSAPDRQ